MANDDFERQARNTTSSLEDLEYKYNAAIERGVLLEEEIKNGDQEREQMRIENQRLRDELSDVKIEGEIVQEKLRNAEAGTSNGRRNRKPNSLYRSPSLTPQTPELYDRYDRSPAATMSSISSPLFTTPPAKASLASSATATPPSPPISESSSGMRKSTQAMPGFPRQKASAGDILSQSLSASTSRSLQAARNGSSQRPGQHHRATSMVYSSGQSGTSLSSRTVPSNHTAHHSTSSVAANGANDTNGTNGLSRAPSSASAGMPKSGSLYQIRGLIGKMQKLEERVQSAKSKLPPPSEGGSRASSRSGSAMGDHHSPLTIRRQQRVSGSGSSFSSSVRDGEIPSYSRPTFSASTGTGMRTPGDDSRPSSRASLTSSVLSYSTHPNGSLARPESRQSRTVRTPLGHYSMNPMTEARRRPGSSLSNRGGMTNITEDDDTTSNTSSTYGGGGGGGGGAYRGTRLPSAPVTPGGIKKRTPSGIPGPASRTPAAASASAAAAGSNGNGELGETY